MMLMKRRFGARTFISICLMGAAFFFGQAVAQAADVVDRIVAVVNDDIVTLSELNRAFRPYVNQIRRSGYSLERQRKVLFEARAQVIDQLIDQKLTDQEAKSMKLKVSEEEIDEAIGRVKERQSITDEQLRQVIQKQGLNMAEYRDQLKEQLLRQQLVGIEVRSKIVITESDIKSAYEEQAERFAGEKKYRLRHILKRYSSWTSEADKKRVRAEMEAVLAKLKAGASFTEMAKTHSESPNAPEGGVLGVIEAKSLPKVSQKALADLSPGQFTGVVDTDQGPQIFLVEEVLKKPGKKLKEVRSQIQDEIYRKRMEAQFKNWIVDLRKRSHIKIIK